jgi:hypothetical protein
MNSGNAFSVANDGTPDNQVLIHARDCTELDTLRLKPDDERLEGMSGRINQAMIYLL